MTIEARTPSVDAGPISTNGAWAAWLIAAFAAIGAMSSWATRDAAPVRQPQLASETPSVSQAERVRFYNASVAPLLVENQRANREAVDRCIERLDEVFQRYHQGVAELADELTSLGTRWAVLRRLPGDWWTQDGRVREFVRAKFEAHLFGEEQLNADVRDVLRRLRTDLRANGAQLLASIRAAVSLSDLPDLTIPSYIAYEREVRSAMLHLATERATESVYHGVATFVVSEVAAVSASQLVVRALALAGFTAVSGTAGSAGAAGGGATAGASGGSVAGPVGAVIGFGVGLVVGVAVDWWMTDQFRGKLERDLGRYVSQLRDGLVEGDARQPGLRKSLTQVVGDLHDVQARVLRQAIVGVAQ